MKHRNTLLQGILVFIGLFIIIFGSILFVNYTTITKLPIPSNLGTNISDDSGNLVSVIERGQPWPIIIEEQRKDVFCFDCSGLTKSFYTKTITLYGIASLVLAGLLTVPIGKLIKKRKL